jgi:hypothetical protein
MRGKAIPIEPAAMLAAELLRPVTTRHPSRSSGARTALNFKNFAHHPWVRSLMRHRARSLLAGAGLKAPIPKTPSAARDRLPVMPHAARWARRLGDRPRQ